MKKQNIMAEEIKEYKKNLGINVKKEREFRGLSREDMAKILGLSASSIGKMESGERGITFESLIMYSKAFNISADTLLKKANLFEPAVSEEFLKEQDLIERKCKQIESLLIGLKSEELNFIIESIKAFKSMKEPNIDDNDGSVEY